MGAIYIVVRQGPQSRVMRAFNSELLAHQFAANLRLSNSRGRYVVQSVSVDY